MKQDLEKRELRLRVIGWVILVLLAAMFTIAAFSCTKPDEDQVPIEHRTRDSNLTLND